VERWRLGKLFCQRMHGHNIRENQPNVNGVAVRSGTCLRFIRQSTA
jgi:hypothetical protein